MSLTYTYDGAAVTHNAAPSGLNVTHRADGEASFGGIPFEDPTATLVVVGHKLVTVEEDECAQPRLFTGFTTERGMGRSLDEGLFVGPNPRLVDMTVVDMNAALGFRQITGSDGNRPAETWADRLTWILESDYLNEFISSDQTWIVTNTTSIEAADYRGAYATAVLDDLVDRSGGAYVYYVFWDTAASETRLFFDNDVETIGPAGVSISNVDADVDGATVFAPTTTSKLAREPDQTYSDVTVVYDRGAKKLYRYRASTATTYVRRGTEISRPYTRGLATATAQAEAWLDKHSVEVDRITCSIQVPADSVGLIQAGQSIDVRFSHLPGYESASFTTMRIVSYSPKPTNDLATHYDVALELVGARPVVEEGCDCLEGDDGTLATGDLAYSVRSQEFGPLHVPAHCSVTITRFDWTEYTNPGNPSLDPPCRISASFLDTDPSQFSLSDPKYATFSGNDTNIKVTHGADLGSDPLAESAPGNGFTLDPSGGDAMDPPNLGYALSGMLIENASDDDFEFTMLVKSNPYFESVGNYSITATYICGEPAVEDEEIDLGPTPGATTTHTVDPTVDDDETLGFGTPGMIWVNTTDGGVFVLVDGTDGAAVWTEASPIAGTVYAPTNADYLVGTAQGGLSDEIVVGTTPGGELGGTWASPTVDATHSGSAHLALGSTSSTAAAGDHLHAGVYVGELLMQDGVTSPPVPIENEAGDDWLYAD
jgi:hypothetical protein